MVRALLYLRRHTLANRTRAQLRRLRQPKYLAGAVFVVAYFWFFFFRPAATSARAIQAGPFAGLLAGDTTALFLGLGAAALTVIVALMWLLPNEAPGIRFTETEIAFLFPAPVSRRTLVRFKVLDGQLTSLLQSCFFALIFSHRHLEHHVVPTILSWWTLLAFVNLHYLGSSLTIARLASRGVDTARRRRLLLAVLGTGLAAAAAGVWHSLPAIEASGSTSAWLGAVLASPVLHALLWPGRLLFAPFFAPGTSGFLLAFVPALAVLVAHYFWVVHSEVAFEEASIAQAERRATRIAELRRSGSFQLGRAPRTGRAAPFDVARARWPELAFLWKNLLSTSRPWFTVRNWALAAGALVLISVVLRRQMGGSYWMAGGFIAALGMMTMGLTLFYGPLITRLDLRRDLANADLLRTYPLPGWRIVLGELLAPAAILSGIIWLGVLMWWLGLWGHQPPSLPLAWFNPAMRVVLAGCAAALAPFVVTLQLIVPNGAAILFPAMFRTVHVPGAGLDLMGQRMLFGFGQIFALLLAFVPAVGLALAAFFMNRGLAALLGWIGLTGGGPAPAADLIAMTLAAGAVVVAEIALGVWWFGRRFERTDLVGETHP